MRPESAGDSDRCPKAPSLKQQAAFYDDRWTHQKISRWNLERANWILGALSRLQLESPKILDFGCGSGWFTTELAKSGSVTAIDLSSAAIESARKRRPDIEWIAGDLFEHSFEPSAYDLVVSQEVIEHVTEQQRYVALMAGALKPGGYVLLTTPNLKSKHLIQMRGWKLQPIEDWLDREGLKRLLEKSFHVLEIGQLCFNYSVRGIARYVPPQRIVLKLPWGHRLWNLQQRLLGRGMTLVAVAKRRG